MMSRTNLKQQLMREQVQQLESREAQQHGAYPKHRSFTTSAIKVPLTNDINFNVPSQLLQSKSNLENPTQYHVQQTQKYTIKQFLDDSARSSQIGTGSSPQVVPMSPIATNASPNSTHSIALSNSLANSPEDRGIDLDDILDGIETLGANEVEEGSDLSFPNSAFFDLLSSDKPVAYPLPHSCPAQIKEESTIPESDLTVLKKDRQKKDNHNRIERNRRYYINDNITELGTLLPKPDEPYHYLAKDMRQSKGTILRATVKYVKLLKTDASKVLILEEKLRNFEEENQHLRMRVQQLEALNQSKGFFDSHLQSFHPSSDAFRDSPLVNPGMLTPDNMEEPSFQQQHEDMMIDDDFQPITGNPLLISPHLIPSPPPGKYS